jgi:protein gp37
MIINKTGSMIPWATHSWNPVKGCQGKCSKRKGKNNIRCYAEAHFNRFKNSLPQYQDMKSFEDVKWNQKNFDKDFPKESAKIFVNSMSDICFWQEKYTEKTFKKIAKFPQHDYMFLTKHPSVYKKWAYDYLRAFWLKNHRFWLGATAINQEETLTAIKEFKAISAGNKYKFLSIEPIKEEIPFEIFNSKIIDWLIVGTETSKKRSEIFIPRYEYIRGLVNYCLFYKNRISLFMKDNLFVQHEGGIKKYKDNWPLIQEWPGGINESI